MPDTYERPVIHRLKTGLMNKFTAAPPAPRVRGEIDGVPVAELAAEFGSPLFVFSERTLRRTYRRLHHAFASRYPHVSFGWSYKTNYLKAVCAVFHHEGALAEVVSAMEYDKARALGVPGERIIFNGPRKPVAVLAAAVRDGATINIDNLDEIDDLERIADHLGRVVAVGLRLNLDAGIQPAWSRFGFNLESGQALAAARRIAEGGKLVVTGLHCHIGTYIMDPEAYGRQVGKMVGFGAQLAESFGWTMDSYDIGGGLPSRSRLKGVYHAAEVAVPALDEYADAICDSLLRALPAGQTPQLIIEAGRAMVDEAGSLIAGVWAAKRLADGTPAYVLDAGINLLFTSAWYRFDIALGQPAAGPIENAVLNGPLCMNIDVVDEGAKLPPLRRGDLLVVSPVGAYNTSQWMQFIEYRPAVVLIGEDGSVAVIRDAEDLSDLERRERLPLRLMPGASAAAVTALPPRRARAG